MTKTLTAALASLGLAALMAACVEVPPESVAPESSRKATAWVDGEGREIKGGRIELIIPPGALADGDRVQVTIDEIVDTPLGHLGDSYLIGPGDVTFLLPVTVRYRYSQRMVQDVVEEELFVGRAQGLGWRPIEPVVRDSQRQIVEGQTQQLGVFGLAYEPIGDIPDGDAGSTTSDADSDNSDASVGQSDAGNSAGDAGNNNQNNDGDAALPPDAGSADPALTVELSWSSDADLDLHLIQEGGSAFSDSDCYFANCRSPIDWAPTGQLNNPQLIVDDTDGYGPEQIAVNSLESGVYLVGAHLYDTHGAPAVQSFDLRVYDHGEVQGEYTWSLDGCDQLLVPLRVRVSDGGVASVEFTNAAPSQPGKASSLCQ